MIQIYHNARCSKSRECVTFFENTTNDVEIINYLKNPPKASDLKILLKKLRIRPIELVRTNEKIWKEKFESQQLSDDQIINAMASHPILIQRPIVVNGDKAVIARPIESIKEVL